MTHAIYVNEAGGPEVLTWRESELPQVRAGQVRIRHTAIGFNMIDTYYRKGLYPVEYPVVIGSEAAGVVEEVGDDAGNLQPGDRVVYALRQIGSYCEQRVMDASGLVKLPDDIDAELIAGGFLKGMTAYVLLHRTYHVKPCDTILVYAASGGVGSIMCQWARHIGTQVIGVVGSPEKITAAIKNGCAVVIDRQAEDIVKTVRELTQGRGVPVVYDSLGKDTFATSLDCLAPLGLMVSFGNATGPVPPLDIMSLMRKGSLFLTRPQLFAYIDEPAALNEAANALFEALRSGVIKIEVRQRYALQDAASAHIAAETGTTMGSTILIP